MFSTSSSLHADLYNHDLVVTYGYYDDKFNDCISMMGIKISDDATSELRGDEELLEYLYKHELLSAFDCETEDQLVLKQDTFYDKFVNKYPYVDLFINPLITSKSLSVLLCNINNTEDMKRAAFRFLFSYDLFFLTHMYLYNVISEKTDNRVTQALTSAIKSLD
jgi:hypothetical protein